MKKIVQSSLVLILALCSMGSFGQKYKSIDDTTRLNKEYVKVSNDLVDLTAKLIIAKNNLPGYQTKAVNAGEDAQQAANSSSDQAADAVNGSVKDAKKAKRKAKRALREAKDSRSADNNVSDQENKITRLNLQITKKQQRIEELDVMRAAILEKIKNQ